MIVENKKLDEYQIDAIKDDHKSVLLVAPAGSGKTLTILGKIQYLINNNINEKEILCISFTNKSVNDLKTRLYNINIYPDIFTFHKLALNILKINKYTLINDNYLNYIIDEYFKSYIFNNKSLYSLYKKSIYYNKKEYPKLKNTIKTFIMLSKAYNLTLNDIYKMYKKNIFINKIYLKYVLEIITIYNRELESINKIDFDDLIVLAIKEIQYSKINYKYIIIDEFQDSSLLRISLIQEIIKKCNSKIFCVGDDYQSIYRFAGCNLNIFLNFKNYFEDASIKQLRNTYRNAEELIYVANSFITKNKNQIKKNIIAHKNINKPIKIFINKSIDYCINYINDKELLILGRNNSDIVNIKYDNKLTIHSSKGLEASNILLVNSDTIPNTIKNEKIINLILNEKEYILHEEERRLFYVALTRTKNNIYIHTNKKISPFIKELIKYYKNYIDIIN